MRLLASILLLLHVNFSMFIAQIDEKDVYDASFQQVHDINSLTEYLQQVFTQNKEHKKQKDSDDDNARYFHVLKPHFFLQPTINVKKESSLLLYKIIPSQNETALASGFVTHPSPPPRDSGFIIYF